MLCWISLESHIITLAHLIGTNTPPAAIPCAPYDNDTPAFFYSVLVLLQSHLSHNELTRFFWSLRFVLTWVQIFSLSLSHSKWLVAVRYWVWKARHAQNRYFIETRMNEWKNKPSPSIVTIVPTHLATARSDNCTIAKNITSSKTKRTALDYPKSEKKKLNRVCASICSDNGHKIRSVVSEPWSCKHISNHKRSNSVYRSRRFFFSHLTYLLQFFFCLFVSFFH